MESSLVMCVEGHVASGTGQGAQFLALGWVRRELERHLALVPFPGTLNVRVPAAARDALFARREQFLRIADASAPECPGYLHRVTLRAQARSCETAWLILPEQSVHRDVLEIISASPLRQVLGVSDGDPVMIEIEPATIPDR